MNAFIYEPPFRPNYEAKAAIAWVAGIALALGAVALSQLPAAPFYWMTAICAAMGFRRASAAYRLWREKRALAGHDTEFIDFEQLKQGLHADPSAIWLGWGFEWDQPHTQKAHDILKGAKAGLLPPQKNMGWSWMHGLEQREADIRLPLKHTEGHVLIEGVPGSGKTRLLDLVVSQCVLRGEPVIIIDPKGDRDLRENTRKACLRSGAPDKYVFLHPADPESSCRIDVLRNFSRPTELAARIVARMASDPRNDAFKAFSHMALNNIIQGLLITHRHPSLVLLRHYVENGPDALVVMAVRDYCAAKVPGWELSARPYLERVRTTSARAEAMRRFYLEEIQPRAPSPDLEGLLSQFEHEREHFNKMIASLKPLLTMLTSGHLGRLLSPDPSDTADARPITDMARIIRNRQVAYIGLDSLSDSMVGSAIGSILLSDLAAVAGARYNFGVGDVPVNLVIDEFSEVLNEPCIQLLNKGRGALFRLIVATQTFADFAAALGDEAKAHQVIGNINNKIVLRTTDPHTQKMVTDALPKTRVRYIVRSQGATSNAANPVLYSGNHGERLLEEEADLFAPQLLGNLPNFEYVATLSGGRLWKGRIPILVDDVAAAKAAVARQPGPNVAALRRAA